MTITEKRLTHLRNAGLRSSWISKAHILITHVPHVIEMTGEGLFLQLEEVVEATHSKFDIFWQRFKVIEVESEKQFLRTTDQFFQRSKWL